MARRILTSQSLSKRAYDNNLNEEVRKRLKEEQDINEEGEGEGDNFENVYNGHNYFSDHDGNNEEEDEQQNYWDETEDSDHSEDLGMDGVKTSIFEKLNIKGNDLDYDSEDFDVVKNCGDFNVMSAIGTTFTKSFQSRENNEISAAKPICSESNMTTDEFYQRFQAISSAGSIELKYQHMLLSLMNEAIPGVNLRTDSNKLQTMKNALPPSEHLIEIDACPNDCYVYVDANTTQCPNVSCLSNRYTADNQKYAKKIMYYRSITSIITVLLSKPIFLRLLNYKYQKPADKPIYSYMDIMDGENCTRHMEAMHRRFQRKIDKGLDAEYIEVSLLISIFYDGIQLFRKKQVNYWPLFFTILNLPPSLRTTVGAGMFLLTAFHGKMDSPTENFLFDKCLINELLFLRAGIKLNIAGKNYFLQVRCIAHVLDTKAVGKQMKVQEVASHSGCPLCHGLKGVTRGELDKSIYHNHRRGLDMQHLCRTIGNSTQCCPPRSRDNYKTHDEYMHYLQSFGQMCVEPEDDKNAVSTILNLRNSHMFGDCVSRRLFTGSNIPKLRICDSNFDIKSFQTGLYNKEIIPTWHHYDNHPDKSNPKFHTYHPQKIMDVMWFRDLDYCSQISFKRRNKQSCLEDGERAEEANAVINIYDSRKKKKKMAHFNGFKGRWAFTRLGYTNPQFDTFFDPGHAKSGVAANIINILKYGTTQKHMTKMLQSLKNNDTHHPYAIAKKPILPWKLTGVSQNKLDDCIDSILHPVGYSEQYQIKNVFSQTGNLRSKAKIMVLTVLIDYIMFCAEELPNGYKTFMSMLGSDFREMMNGHFDKETIESLKLKVLETVSVFESLFGDAECVFLFHELIHIPEQIIQLGPIAGWWTFSGESALRFVKENRPDGGKSFDKTIMHRYDAAESGKYSEIYNSISDQLSKYGLCEQDNKLVYRTHYVQFSKVISGGEQRMSPIEVQQYLIVLVDSILIQCNGDKKLAITSPVYRLYTAYMNHRECGIVNKEITFHMFIYLLKEIYHGKKTIPATGNLHHYFHSLITLFIKRPDQFRHSVTEDQHFCESGEISTMDLVVACHVLNFGEFRYFSRVTINGEVFRGRGMSHRESEDPQNVSNYGAQPANFKFTMVNERNNLRNEYYNGNDYSSWCKYKKGTTQKYAQINYMFRIILPIDSILHGTPIANIVGRKHVMVGGGKQVAKIEAVNNAYRPEECDRYIPVTSIFPTAILVAPFSSTGPITDITTRRAPLSHLILLDLHPQNTTYTPETFSNKAYNSFQFDTL
jgi:hypothetical protein